MDSEAVVVDSEARGRGLVRLVGYSVQTYDGTPLGKVRAPATCMQRCACELAGGMHGGRARRMHAMLRM